MNDEEITEDDRALLAKLSGWLVQRRRR